MLDLQKSESNVYKVPTQGPLLRPISSYEYKKLTTSRHEKEGLSNFGRRASAVSTRHRRFDYSTISKIQATGYHHMFSFFADDNSGASVCQAYLLNKESYCKKHGLLWSFRRMYFTPHRHQQEALAMRISIAAQLLLSAHNAQVTYMDFDTFIPDHNVAIDPLFDKADEEHDFTCSVYVQADPYLLNSGFWSVMNTDWVREEFMPKWEALRLRWERSGVGGSHTGAMEPDQKSFMATIMHFALREKGMDTDVCGARDFDLGSEKWQNVTREVAKWVASLPGGYPGEEYYVRKVHQVPGIHKDLTSYKVRLDGTLKNGGFFYSCFNWAMESLLGLPFLKRSFPVGKTDGVCFLGFEGKQFNRHHWFPPHTVKLLQNFTYKEASGKRHGSSNFGKAYSNDLFSMHAHLEKNDPNFCTRTVAANDQLTSFARPRRFDHLPSFPVLAHDSTPSSSSFSSTSRRQL